MDHSQFRDAGSPSDEQITTFVKTERSFPHSQQPGNGPHPQPNTSSPQYYIQFKNHFNIILLSNLQVYAALFPSTFTIKIVFQFFMFSMHAARPQKSIFFDFSP
jgi:hypothetical protein